MAAVAVPRPTDEVGLLRQKVIVQLVRDIPWQPDVVTKFVSELIQHQVLTQEVCEEVRTLLIEKGLGEFAGCGCDADGTAVQAQGAAAPAPPGLPAAAPAAAVARAKSRFDQEFERLELLGRGGFGEVWRARNRLDRKDYAVKVVPFRFDPAGGPLDHPAVREARVWASVDHPSAIRYHAAWVEVDEEPEPQQNYFPPMQPLPPVHITVTDSSFTRSTTYSGASSDTSSCGVVFEESAGSAQGAAPGAAQGAAQGATPGGRLGDGTATGELQVARRVPPDPAQAPPARGATLYVQAELVQGGTLRDWIDRRNAAFANGCTGAEQKASVEAAEHIFRELVDAVATLHAQGIVHRDIKPSNVLLTESGRVRLGDFGLAKETSAAPTAPALPDVTDVAGAAAAVAPAAPAAAAGDGPHTRGAGTPTYASPEQLSQASYGFSADVYALGVVLAELLVPTRTQMERAQLLEGLRAGRQPRRAEAACAGAGEVVFKMTSLDPNSRPTARELALILRQRSLQRAWPALEGPRAVGDMGDACVGGSCGFNAL